MSSSSAITDTISELTGCFGPPASVTYSGGSVLARFPRPGAGLDDTLSAVGAQVDHSVDVPAPAGATTSIRIGRLRGLPFQLEADAGPHCLVRLFSPPDSSEAAGTPWLAEHRMMDSLLARSGNKRQALLAYIERELLTNPDSAQQLAGDVAYLVAGYLRKKR